MMLPCDGTLRTAVPNIKFRRTSMPLHRAICFLLPFTRLPTYEKQSSLIQFKKKYRNPRFATNVSRLRITNFEFNDKNSVNSRQTRGSHTEFASFHSNFINQWCGIYLKFGEWYMSQNDSAPGSDESVVVPSCLIQLHQNQHSKKL